MGCNGLFIFSTLSKTTFYVNLFPFTPDDGQWLYPWSAGCGKDKPDNTWKGFSMGKWIPCLPCWRPLDAGSVHSFAKGRLHDQNGWSYVCWFLINLPGTFMPTPAAALADSCMAFQMFPCWMISAPRAVSLPSTTLTRVRSQEFTALHQAIGWELTSVISSQSSSGRHKTIKYAACTRRQSVRPLGVIAHCYAKPPAMVFLSPAFLWSDCLFDGTEHVFKVGATD